MSFWHWIVRRRQENRELDEEVTFHVAQEAQLRIDRGEPAESAWRSARRDFGNVALAKEYTRESWGLAAFERAGKDLRYAARMLRKNPSFTAVALATLTLGIGATTAMFSVVHSILLRPLAFPEPDRLVMVWETQPSGRPNVIQTQNFLDWRSRNRSFSGIAAFMQLGTNLAGDGDPVQVPGFRVTAGFFEILGTAPAIGRTIQAEDDVPGARRVVVLSGGLWQRRFGARRDVVGRTILVDGSPTEIIGVMPAGFVYPTARADLFIPMRINPATAPRDGRNYRSVARLRPGVMLPDAIADMRGIAVQTAQERPAFNTRWSATVIPLMEQTVGDSKKTLWVLLGAVICVLLIACANVANLLLMRAGARRREMTLRVALGAGRWRLMHQLLTESLLLAVTGGALGFLAAKWGVPALIGILPQDFPLPRLAEIAVDRTVLGFTLLISIGCGIVFGMAPALQLDAGRMSEGLREGGRHGTGGSRTLRNVLVVTEVAMASLLVIGAGLMVRSFALLQDTNPGFQTERLLTFRMMLLFSKYAGDLPRRAAVMQQMVERIRALPTVASASSVHMLPMVGSSGTGYYRMDRPAPPPGSGTGGDVLVVSDGYFRTMGTPLIAGRDFDARDRIGSPGVAILNQAAAQYLYPGENPLGKRLKVFWSPVIPEFEVIGIAADVRHHGLANRPDPCLFVSNLQNPSMFASLVVRTVGGETAAIAAVKEQMRQVDPDQGIQSIQTMKELVGDNIAKPRLQTTVMSLFGAVALALACLGIYAVVSYSVVQRTREMGIRLALGAAPASILRMVLREGFGLALGGIVAGVAAGLALTRYLGTLLYAIKPTDPAVYAAVSAILAAAAIAGCYFPARRATRVDPAVVLREE